MSPIRTSLPIYLCLLLATPIPLSAQEPKKPEIPPAPAKGPADDLLDQAIAKAGNMEGLETRFREQLNTQGVRFSFEGKYAAGPKRQVFYEARIRVGDGEATIRNISNGTTVWRSVKTSGRTSGYTYTLADLDKQIEKLQDDMKDYAEEDRQLVIKDVRQDHGFAGVQPLLVDLKKRMVFAKPEQTTLTGRGSVHRLEGEWTKAVKEKIAPPRPMDQPNAPDAAADWEKREDFIFFPRKCVIYLSVDSLWPVRVEWLGPMARKGNDEILLALDFDPPKPFTGKFEATEEETKQAEKIDASIFVRARRDQFTQQQQREEELKKRRPLDPTLGAPVPSTGPLRP